MARLKYRGVVYLVVASEKETARCAKAKHRTCPSVGSPSASSSMHVAGRELSISCTIGLTLQREKVVTCVGKQQQQTIVCVRDVRARITYSRQEIS